MFREVTRKKQVLSNEEVVELLKKQLRGVLSVLGDDDYPYGLPINHYYNEEDGCLYFHGGKTGHKIDSIRKHDKVSFCVYDEGYRIGDDWPLHIKSVIVFGKVEFVEDEKVVAKIGKELSLKFTDDEKYIEDDIRNSLKNTLMFRLVPEHITGKIVEES